MLEYHAAYYQIEDGWYMACVLDFPGANSQGKTLRSARRNIKDALQLMVEASLEEGWQLPKPNPRARDKKALAVEPMRVNVRISQATSG
jgi:predicted RNase H-like HicB family nuclease